MRSFLSRTLHKHQGEIRQKMAPQIEEMMLRECDASLWLTEGNILLKHAY